MCRVCRPIGVLDFSSFDKEFPDEDKRDVSEAENAGDESR